MGQIKRETIMFLLPTDSVGIENVGEFGTKDAGGFVNKKMIQLYLNPDQIQINETKIAQSTNTKGGFMVQYWGEQLATIQMTGTTGSGGVEAINILREIYRHELGEFENVLRKRARLNQQKSKEALLQTSNPNGNSLLTAAIDFSTGGLFSQVTNGLDTLGEMFSGNFETPQEKERRSFTRTPTLASLATGVEMYYQGEIFRGYFTQFSSTESSSNLGIFSYNMNFTILDRRGNRDNFMPWHRNPRSPNGTPRMASTPIEGPRPDEMSYKSNYSDDNNFPGTLQSEFLKDDEVFSNIFQNQTGISSENFVPISRRNKISGKG
jgi:hypothetical protein